MLGVGDGLDVTVSPFTLIFEMVLPETRIFAHLMNGVILSAVLSAGNSAMYASSRTLMAMAEAGLAPSMFATVSSRGVPLNALIFVTAFGCLSFLSVIFGNTAVFGTLLSFTGVSGILTWISISFIHIRFRAAFKAQGMSGYIIQDRSAETELPYRAPFFPVGPWVGLILGGGIVLMQGYAVFETVPFQVQNFFTSYLGIPVFIGLFFAFRYSKSTRFVDPAEADLDTNNIESVID
jgi:lysine-specific permease